MTAAAELKATPILLNYTAPGNDLSCWNMKRQISSLAEQLYCVVGMCTSFPGYTFCHNLCLQAVSRADQVGD